MSRFHFYAAYIIGILILPLALFVLGVRGNAVENRVLAAPPTLSSPNQLLSTKTYEQFTDFMRDRIPFRAPAIRVDALIDYEIFNDPTGSVLFGSEEWLYLRDSVDLPCTPDSPTAPATFDAMSRIDNVLRSSGRDVIWVIAPNKEAIHSEHTKPFSELRTCVLDKREELQTLLGSSSLIWLNTWQSLDQLRIDSGQDVYLKYDSHWNLFAATSITADIVETIQPGLFDPAKVTTGDLVQAPSDLLLQAGLPGSDEQPNWQVDRSVTTSLTTTGAGFKPAVVTTATGGEFIEAETLIILDSFGEWLQPSLSQYFSTATWLDWRGFEDTPDPLVEPRCGVRASRAGNN